MAKIRLRRDTYTNWFNTNPVLALGEPAYDTTNNKIKVGDGVNAWRDLSYLTDATNNYSDSNVAAYLSDFAGNITTSGTITATDYVGSGDLLTGFADVARSGSYNDLADTPVIPSIPTNVSVFTNDAGYITSSTANVISVNGQTGAVTIDVGPQYTDSNVAAYLSNFDGNIVPSANVAYNLGSATQRWKDLFLSNSTIYLGDTPVSATADTLLVNGSPTTVSHPQHVIDTITPGANTASLFGIEGAWSNPGPGDDPFYRAMPVDVVTLTTATDAAKLTEFNRTWTLIDRETLDILPSWYRFGTPFPAWEGGWQPPKFAPTLAGSGEMFPTMVMTDAGYVTAYTQGQYITDITVESQPIGPWPGNPDLSISEVNGGIYVVPNGITWGEIQASIANLSEIRTPWEYAPNSSTTLTYTSIESLYVGAVSAVDVTIENTITAGVVSAASLTSESITVAGNLNVADLSVTGNIVAPTISVTGETITANIASIVNSTPVTTFDIDNAAGIRNGAQFQFFTNVGVATVTSITGTSVTFTPELTVTPNEQYMGGIRFVNPGSSLGGNAVTTESIVANIIMFSDGTTQTTAATGDVGFSGQVIYNKTDYNQGLYVAPGGESTSYVYVPGNSQSVDTSVQIINSSTGGIEVGSNGNYWSFQADGTLRLPNFVKQVPAQSVQCLPNVDTVVYTGTAQWQHTFKLLLQAEGIEDGNVGQWDTQSAEMIIAKSYLNDKVAASLYGRVYTSVNPLATFTAQWNAISNRVEVTCRPTSTTNNVWVRTFATEITSSD